MAAWARIEVGFYTWFEPITPFDMRQAKPIYYSATSFKSRLDLLRAALDGIQLDRKEETFIRAAMAVVIGYNSFRNKLAHGEFTFDGLLIEGKHVDRRRARRSHLSGAAAAVWRPSVLHRRPISRTHGLTPEARADAALVSYLRTVPSKSYHRADQGGGRPSHSDKRLNHLARRES
jgi:hypothetical protein